jgi:hypothetical protein
VELRPDIVKIDRSLVARLHEDRARAAVTELLGAFTERVGGALLAEGIEQLDELSALLNLDVHLGQGYLLGRPQFGWASVPVEAAQMLTARSRAERQVASLVRPIPTARNVAAIGFLDEELPELAFVADRGSVHGLWVRNQLGGPTSGWLRPVTAVSHTTTLRAALCRAMERAAIDRLDPLVCVDGAGVVLGIVTVDALVSALVVSPAL